MLLVGAPLWLLIAALIKLDSEGPVFYVQSVLGKDGQVFSLFKFRTMHVGSDDLNEQRVIYENMKERRPTAFDREGRPIYKTSLKDDQRITRVGKYLRRLSLDEVPQFWNVLSGEMSFVGPRPALPYEALLYSDEQKRRFHVEPGITGLYQVTVRNRVSIPEMIEIDLEYIKRRSFMYDLWIVIRTPAAMFRGL
jgi:lipopolysaccharide/colanic/teichoic acid biosynthesis glycosyltransferase